MLKKHILVRQQYALKHFKWLYSIFHSTYFCDVCTLFGDAFRIKQNDEIHWMHHIHWSYYIDNTLANCKIFDTQNSKDSKLATWSNLCWNPCFKQSTTCLRSDWFLVSNRQCNIIEKMSSSCPPLHVLAHVFMLWNI